MESVSVSLLQKHPSATFLIIPQLPHQSSNLCNSSLFFAAADARRRCGRLVVVAAAKKKPQEKGKAKSDRDSYAVRPDESTGPFPEAVLLKQKKVQEDGRLLPEFEDAEEEELFQMLNLQLESDLDVERVRHYEVVYLIHENYAEDVEKVNEKVRDFLREKKGRVWRVSDWGMRRLAYKIQKASRAHYMLMNFELEAKWINEFKELLDNDERVIRHLVIKRDEAITEDCPPPPEFHTMRAGTEDEDEEEEEDEDDDVEYYDGEDDDEEEGIVADIDDSQQDQSNLAMEKLAGCHPFGPFSNATQVSQLLQDAALRNTIYARVDSSLHRIRDTSEAVQAFASEYLKTPLGEPVKGKKNKTTTELWLEKFYKKKTNMPEPFPHELVERLEKYLDSIEEQLVDLSFLLYDHRLQDAHLNSSDILQSSIFTQQYVDFVLASEREKMKCCSIEYKFPVHSSQSFIYGGILLAGLVVYFIVIFFSSPQR